MRSHAAPLAIFLLASCSLSPKATPQWAPFRWQSITLGNRTFEHAALMVPVTIAGVAGSYELQLDLGTGWPTLNGIPFTQALANGGGPAPSGETHALTGRIGALAISEYPFRLRPTGGARLQDPKAGKIGSLGLNFFLDRILVIDFPRERFAIMSPAALPPDFVSRVSWVPARLEAGHVFVPVRIGSTEYSRFFYDTGASIFPLTTSRSTWQRVTRHSGKESDLDVLTVPSWGKQVTLIGAPAAEEISVGGISMAHASVFFLAEGNDDLKPENWDPPIDGTIGNSFFLQSTVILDLPHGRLGIMTSPLTSSRFESCARAGDRKGS